MSTPTQINHVVLGQERLLSQWTDSPKLQGLLESFLNEVNQLEEVFFQLLNERGIFEAAGTQLDLIGSLFGLSRDNRTDDQYRSAILIRITLLNTDGTTEVLLEALRTLTNSDFVDFWEHDSGDVHALLGGGYDVYTYGVIKDLVAAGVSIRAYVDDEFDSFSGTELIKVSQDLQTNNDEDIQVTDGTLTYDLQIQTNQFDDTADNISILPEIIDNIETPYLAELLFSEVTVLSGDLVDDQGNLVTDASGNNIIWIDYQF